jgi:mono/diheme cytochrome c family protein
VKRVLAAGALAALAFSGPFAWARKERGSKPYAQLASVPDSARVRPNPFGDDPEAGRAGKKLYARHCADCHGAGGENGRKGPSLRAPEIQDATPGALFWVLTNGAVRAGMPAWSKLPEPQRWQSITEPGERLRFGLTELYKWFEATEAVMTNSFRDYGAVKESAEALQPVGEVFQSMYMALVQGWEGSKVPPLISLALDFATWKKLHREQAMASSSIVELWADLIRCMNVG